jgi:hypothetical protein
MYVRDVGGNQLGLLVEGGLLVGEELESVYGIRFIYIFTRD